MIQHLLHFVLCLQLRTFLVKGFVKYLNLMLVGFGGEILIEFPNYQLELLDLSAKINDFLLELCYFRVHDFVQIF